MVMVMTIVTSTSMASNNNRSWNKQGQRDLPMTEQKMQKNDQRDIHWNGQRNDQRPNNMVGCLQCNSRKNGKTYRCAVCNKKNCKKHNYCPSCGRDLRSLNNSFGNMNRPFDSKR